MNSSEIERDTFEHINLSADLFVVYETYDVIQRHVNSTKLARNKHPYEQSYMFKILTFAFGSFFPRWWLNWKDIFNILIIILIQTGNTRAAKILLENGADPNAYNELLKESALQAAFDHSMLHVILERYWKLCISNE